MKNQKFILKAAQQVLCEALGYDEGRAYYLLLTKKENEFEKIFSYSKRYRLMKSLFEQGAVGKIKPEEQDFFSYFLLPPTFLYSKESGIEIIEFLERIYLDNFAGFLENEFAQLILKDEKGLLIFLLKYFMKEEARVSVEDFSLELLGENRKKVELIKKEYKERIGTIDRRIAFEFFDIRNGSSSDLIGYLAKNGLEKGGKDYVSVVEKQLSHY